MTHVYPLVQERVTRFSREALLVRDARMAAGQPTITIDQLNTRYQNYCGPCQEFSGVICGMFGCSTQVSSVRTYFEMVLSPGDSCRFIHGGFPAIESNSEIPNVVNTD